MLQSMFQLSGFSLYTSAFAATQKKKRSTIGIMRRPFELCLQDPNSVFKQRAQMGHSRVCCMESCIWYIELQHSAGANKIFCFTDYSWLNSSLIRFNTSLQRSPFTATVLPLLPSSQYGSSISFFDFNA